MSLTLACAWQVRGELPRLQRLYPAIAGLYAQTVIALNGDAPPEVIPTLEALGIRYAIYAEWSGRHDVMRLALQTESPSIHYVDMDRLLRWIETRPAELREIVGRIPQSDCLVIGRTPAAWETHPQCMIQTEYLPNRFFSTYFGSEWDFGAGSKGFSREAVRFVLRHDPDGAALHMDIAWPVLLRRGGFALEYVEADGLDYESADQYQPNAADAAAQRHLAEAVDADPGQWALRVRVAKAMTDAALTAAVLPLGEDG